MRIHESISLMAAIAAKTRTALMNAFSGVWGSGPRPAKAPTATKGKGATVGGAPEQ